MDGFLKLLLLLGKELFFLLELDILLVVSGHLFQYAFGSFLDLL